MLTDGVEVRAVRQHEGELLGGCSFMLVER
jgi:hypothetical protein